MTKKDKKQKSLLVEVSEKGALIEIRPVSRRRVLGFIAGLFSGISLLFARGFKGTARAAEQDNRLATALFAEGTLVVTRADGSTKRLSGQGSLPLFEGDKLETGRVSQGFLLFRDGSRMALNNSTVITIRSRKDDKGTVQEIKLGIGEIWALVSEKTKRFEVETPNALAGVSGTEFGENYKAQTSTLTVGKGLMDFGVRLAEERILDQIPTQNRTKVMKGKQSAILQRGRPSEPVEVNVDLILGWGRALNARFGPKGLGIDEEGVESPRGIPSHKGVRPGGSSH